jgi:SAM-dependent methyltransferase
MRRLACTLLASAWAALPLAARATEEVPFVTTPDNVTAAMLEAAGVGPRDFVIDLGSGDGRIVITAARRFGARGLGVEIVPELVERSRTSAQRAGVAERAEFRVQDLFATDLSPASVITMYLLPEVNLQLRPKLLALAPGTRIVSHDWDMGDWTPDRTRTVVAPDKKIGLEKTSRVHLWVVPAPVEGRWCGPQQRWLALAQRFQRLEGSAGNDTDRRAVTGLVDGSRVALVDRGGPMVAMEWSARGLQVTEAAAAYADWRGQQFERCH